MSSSICKIALISDIHIMSPFAKFHSLRNLQAITADLQKLGCSHLHVGGDFTNGARGFQYHLFFQEMKRMTSLGIHTTISLGNHDVRGAHNHNPLALYQTAIQSLYQRPIETLYYEEVIGDMPCLMINTEQCLRTSAYLSIQQLHWLQERLDAYEKTNTTVFVCSHQPLTNIHPNSDGLGLGEQEEAVKAMLKKRKNIIFLSGHLHNNYEHVNVVETAYGIHVDIPSFHMNEHGRMKRGCGYVLQIEGKHIRIRLRNFLQQVWIGEEWVLHPYSNNVVKGSKPVTQRFKQPLVQEAGS